MLAMRDKNVNKSYYSRNNTETIEQKQKNNKKNTK